jgi:Fe-S oxidoreductase
MGMIDNFGRIADVYISEKEKLKDATEERRRVFTGHPFWPHEVLRDTIILGAMIAVLSFYSWLIPPPLHASADPFAQAGFVFPDWYVLFSYGYLRWGEYLPQFDIPLPSIIGNFFGSPVISWNAGWWGSFLTGIPVGILTLPPFLGGRAKRGVEDPWFAAAGVVYLAHVWFISVYSINIFLELYGKNRSDFCQLNSHGGLNCGVRQPWLTEVFNAIPWILTGFLLWIILYFGIRWYMVKSGGARTTPAMGKQVALGTLVIAVLLSAVSWPVYDGGFWDIGGFGAMDDVDELETLRNQPSDTLLAIDEGHHWESMEENCLTYGASSGNIAWQHKMFEGVDAESRADYCLLPAIHWLNWGIYQPVQWDLIDYNNENNHQQLQTTDGEVVGGVNIVDDSFNFNGSNQVLKSYALSVEDLGLEEVTLDISCSFRTSTRKAGTHSIAANVVDSTNTVVASIGGDAEDGLTCTPTTFKVAPGEYTVNYQLDSTFATEENASVTVDSRVFVQAFQPLFFNPDTGMTLDRTNGTELALAGLSGDAALAALMIENPTYHKNPKSLDAKLTYSLFIPPLGCGAIVFVVMRGMARGYEYEMNKCYGCDLCDDACPVRMFNAGDKLNIIYNTWNNEDDGVPMYSCLTCTACTNACPQLVDYDSYVDIRRNLVVGGPPTANIPHTVLQAVLAAEAEEESDELFIAIDDYPIDSTVGYYPGCVDYLDQEMVFSHVNEGTMNLGDTTTAAFTLFEEMGVDVTYLGRDFLKCCGHDQKWQGMEEVFEKLKAYNKQKLEASGIDTLVSSCAECFRTFAMDYDLEGIKVMHTTEYLIENGFDMDLAVDDEMTVTFHDPCRLGRQMNIYDGPRDLIEGVEGVNLVEMEHTKEDAMCCGVSSMMSCNEDSRTIRVQRFEEVRATGAEIMLTSCPKCVTHFECLKFEGDPRHDFEILDVVSFLARQVDAKKERATNVTEVWQQPTTDEVEA